jgi:hypothetical protein
VPVWFAIRSQSGVPMAKENVPARFPKTRENASGNLNQRSQKRRLA